MTRTEASGEQRVRRVWRRSVIVGIWVLLAVLISMHSLNGLKPQALEPAAHDPAVYQEVPSGYVVAPVSAAVQPLDRLLLINFEDHNDSLYVGLEPQVVADPQQGYGLLVVAWRIDDYVDVYHQPGLRLEPSTYEIAGSGLHQMLERPLTDAYLEITAAGVATFFAFEDILGRDITVRIQETSSRTRRPFPLLAPMGDAVSEPTSLPLVVLDDFYFVRRSGTMAELEIAGEPVELGSLPIPMDLQRMYFLRYSPDPLIVKLNPAHDGVLPLLSGEPEESESVQFVLVDNFGYTEISQMRVSHGAMVLDFEPPLPNVVDLRDGVMVNGTFKIHGSTGFGTVGGVYSFQRSGHNVNVLMTPSHGWQPRTNKVSLWLLYAVQPLFRTWPQTYIWEAVLDTADLDAIHMQSQWRRSR